MKTNLKKAIVGIASSLVILVNVLAPSQANANNLAVAKQVAPASTEPTDSLQPEHTTVIVVIFIVVATMKGLQFTDNAQTNLANLD